MSMEPAPQPTAAADRRRNRLESFFRNANRLPDYAAGLITCAMLVSVLIQIISRLIGRPVAWTEEGTRFLFVWMIFLGIAAGFRKAESARVTFFLGLMPPAVRGYVGTGVYAVATVAFFVVVAWTGTDLVLQQIRTSEMGSALMIPMWLVGICVPISALLGILGVVESLLLRPETITGKEE